MPQNESLSVGLLLFPQLTQLDLTGPWEVFSSLPGVKTALVWKTLEPVTSAKGMRICPDLRFEDCPQFDVICIPGGPGMNSLLTDPETLDFVRKQARGARYVTSVCTGSLVLGAAGLLRGKRAACHWMSRYMLRSFGAIPVQQRVVMDGNTITGGGVTAGIDFARHVAAQLFGARVAQAVQLGLEYNPEPPFNAGSPSSAPPEVVQELLRNAEPLQAARKAQVETAARALAMP